MNLILSILFLFMNELIIYTINFTNARGKDVEIQIHDRKNYDPTIPGDAEVRYVALTGGKIGLQIKCYNNERDKFAAFVGKQATFSFKNTSSYGMSTFSSGPDNRFYVRATYDGGSKFIFSGFLVQDGNTEPYLAPGKEVVLTAIDNLGTLQGHELTDLDGNKVRGHYSLIQFAAFCLQKTGLEYDIKVVDNLFERRHNTRGADPINGPWHQTYIDAATFEKDINVSEDCWTVLNKILASRKSRLTQYNGDWWITRTDELKNNGISFTRYTKTGAIGSGTVDYVNHIRLMDDVAASDVYFIGEDTNVEEQRPHNYDSLQWAYDTPKESICNIDFERGDFFANLADEMLDGILYNAKRFNIECWQYIKGVTPVAQDSQAYIKRLLYNGYERERYIRMDVTAANGFYYLKCIDRIPLEARDKFRIGTSFRYGNDLGGGSGAFSYAQIWCRLYGDDGTFWNLQASNNSNPQWRQSDATWLTNEDFVFFNGFQEATNFNEWQSVSVESAPLPVSGYLEVLLVNNQRPDQQFKDWSNLQFEFIPFVTGSYGKYNSESYKVSRAPSLINNYSAFREDQVYLADSTRRFLKGAYKIKIGDQYVLTDLWEDWAATHSGFAGLGPDRILKWLVYDLWNQFRLDSRVFVFSSRGLNNNVDSFCDIPHRYVNNVSSLHNMNRWFLMLDMEQDWYTEKMTGTMIEINYLPDQRSYADVFEFKFLR
jgi:hypothetical protein